MLIDTHSHLFDDAFKNDLNDCINRAKENGIGKIILVGFNLKTNQQALILSKRDSIFCNTAGIHPSEASENYIDDINELEKFINENTVYAIGECGLDYYWVKDNKAIQKELFEEQIKLAIKYNLPLIVHMREAAADTYEILAKYKNKLVAILHCYSGSYEMALKFVELGFYISLGGPVTFKNAKDSKIVAEKISLDRLLIETDCPYLAPVPYRGQRNESSYVKNICEEIALIRGMKSSEIEQITTNNASKIFKL